MVIMMRERCPETVYLVLRPVLGDTGVDAIHSIVSLLWVTFKVNVSVNPPLRSVRSNYNANEVDSFVQALYKFKALFSSTGCVYINRSSGITSKTPHSGANPDSNLRLELLELELKLKLQSPS